ncbi:hypothetical protein [Streptomyces spectabilis]|uniref:Uncharacterized protein n=1 Tax=Streptomyces spectabilis TaxID=68270 RepID=A0A7W8B4Z3_STRST|nr:hypothetical protein [Streptomyces spectabilis]MBB5109791.1 hypothetical protein [Streptomyces spectabilis]GGV55597.1 hypothetical protein GCM10010245_88190 [Streptomyces spectabilis]
MWVDSVAPEELDAGVAQTMRLFQKQVAEEADIRLTAVGDRLFAVRIDGSPGLDWRRHCDHLSYTLIDTPPERVLCRTRSLLLVEHLEDRSVDLRIRRHRTQRRLPRLLRLVAVKVVAIVVLQQGRPGFLLGLTQIPRGDQRGSGGVVSDETAVDMLSGAHGVGVAFAAEVPGLLLVSVLVPSVARLREGLRVEVVFGLGAAQAVLRELFGDFLDEQGDRGIAALLIGGLADEPVVVGDGIATHVGGLETQIRDEHLQASVIACGGLADPPGQPPQGADLDVPLGIVRRTELDQMSSIAEMCDFQYSGGRWHELGHG